MTTQFLVKGKELLNSVAIRRRALYGAFKIWQGLPRPLKSRLSERRLQIKAYRKIFTPGDSKQYVAHIASGPNEGKKISVTREGVPGYTIGNYEPEVAAALDEICEEGMTVADIGAHFGYFTLLMGSKVSPGGHVFSFEPSPETCTILRDTVAANNLAGVTVVELAVSDTCGVMPFDSKGCVTTGRLLQSDNPAPQTVETTTLDDFAKRSGVRRLDVVKIDVEGAELAVLLGMRHVLASMKPKLLIELHRHFLTVDEINRVYGLLENAGYSLERLTVWSRGFRVVENYLATA